MLAVVGEDALGTEGGAVTSARERTTGKTCGSAMRTSRNTVQPVTLRHSTKKHSSAYLAIFMGLRE